MVRQLVAAGLLRVDVAGYGALQLAEACAPVLSGDQTVELRRDRKRQTREQTAPSPAETLPDTPEADRLFDVLRDLRLSLARDQEVPPYVIFHDRTLAAMVRHQPQTLAEFRQLPGVGDVKLERYGRAFLDCLKAHATDPADGTTMHHES